MHYILQYIIYFNTFSLIYVDDHGSRVAVQRQGVADAVMKTFSYDVSNKEFKPYCPGARRTVERDKRYTIKKLSLL